MRKIYNKLVRDKMVEVYNHDIENKISAEDYSIRHLDKKELVEELKRKLLEEAEEVFEAYGKDREHLEEEIADVIEVIDAILYHNDISLDEVLKSRDKKRELRGGFKNGLYLEYIDYLDKPSDRNI